MSFTVRGVHHGQPFELTWNEGKLDGTPPALLAVEHRLDDPEPVSQTATGPLFPPALTPDFVAWLTIGEAVDRVDVTDGMPTFPETRLPDGAVSGPIPAGDAR